MLNLAAEAADRARITICSIKRKENFFSLFFLAQEQKNSGIFFSFFLSDMKFCFMKGLFFTALEETMSVASQKKSAVVAGPVLNFGTWALFYRIWSFVLWNDFFRVRARTLSANQATTEAADRGDREADYMCLSPLQRKTSKLEGEEE
jgi:hypothetical protein